MKLHYVIAALLLAILNINAADRHANEVAIEVIQQESRPDYIPRDGSEQEAVVAAAINSRNRLNKMMLQADLSDELRICYAIQLLTVNLERIKNAKAVSIGQKDTIAIYTREQMAKRDLLAKSLIK